MTDRSGRAGWWAIAVAAPLAAAVLAGTTSWAGQELPASVTADPPTPAVLAPSPTPTVDPVVAEVAALEKQVRAATARVAKLAAKVAALRGSTARAAASARASSSSSSGSTRRSAPATTRKAAPPATHTTTGASGG